jgi:pyruvyltransferase
VPDHHSIVRGVPVVRWDPVRRGPSGPRRVGNFGDLLGPLIVRALVGGVPVVGPRRARLVAVGSILHLSRPGDVVWGAGVNGKMPLRLVDPARLDVRTVRGPLTRAVLEGLGVPVGPALGDPGLLVSDVFPDLPDRAVRRPRRDVTIIPNLNDRSAFRDDPRSVDPTAPVSEVVRAVAESRVVVASSLHALVVADALGVDARPLASIAEHPFKYADHYAGTGRPGALPARDVPAALMSDGPGPAVVDLDALRACFPHDLWAPRRPAAEEARVPSPRPPAVGTDPPPWPPEDAAAVLDAWLARAGRLPEPHRFSPERDGEGRPISSRP